MEIATEILIILILIMCNGCFAMSELAVVSARKSILQKKASKGNKRAQSALLLVEDTGRFLPTVQIGITLIGILVGTFSGATLSEELTRYLTLNFGMSNTVSTSTSITIVVILISYLTLIIGELAPKRLALRYPEYIAMLLAPALNLLSIICSPIITFLEFSSNILFKIFGISINHKHLVTEEEIEALLIEGSESGALKPEEKEMIIGVMRLVDKSIKSIMTPKAKVVWIDINEDIEVTKHKILSSTYSRFVVCDNTIENVLGIIQSKDIVNHLLKNNNLNIHSLITKVPFFSDSAPNLNIIKFLKESPIHMAIIIDEYGILEGIITATNIFDAIVEEPQENDIQKKLI